MRGFGSVAERLRRATVQVVSGSHRGFGSGIVWDNGGLVLTNAHVARQGEAQVQLWDGRKLAARLVSSDPRRDVAALRIAATDLEPVAPGDSSAVKPGELVIAVGNPLGFAGALSTGVVHSVGPIPRMGGQKWIRADVRLAPGNSGGPLADALGRVIGINTAILDGLGVAVPVNDALAFLRRGPRPSLGVTLRPVSRGLMILEIEAGGAAEGASLRPGDVLPISVEALHEALDSGRETLRLPFLRGGNQRVRQTVVRLEAQAVAA
jgi:serine protease Do